MKSLRSLAMGCLLAAPLLFAGAALGADGYGKLAGVILDPAGTPQMGAAVWVSAEGTEGRGPARLLSNQSGSFTAQRLRPGLYSVRVTLSGFLPSVEEHIHVNPDATTLLRIEMDSVFTSFDRLRRPPAQPSDTDDWKWVLRTSASARPVLQWRNGSVIVASSNSPYDLDQRRPRGRVEVGTGMREPGSSSALPGSPMTAVSYDQPLGRAGLLLVSGGMIYNGPAYGPGVAFASVWMPSGVFGQGPETTFVMREVSMGQQGQRIRNMRLDHSEHMALGDHAALEYGAEYLMAGLDNKMTAELRPRARVGMQLSPQWTAALALETEPGSYRLRSRDAALGSATDALDTLPVLIWKDGASNMEGSWHAEFSARRKLGSRGSVEAAAFHDSTAHEAVFGYGAGIDGDLQTPMARTYAHDAGTSSAWGTRVVFRHTIYDNFEVAAIYAWAGALAPDAAASTAMDLHDALHTQYRHSVAGRVSGKVPRVGTQFAASYKWIDGTVVSRQDVFGEALLGLDPNLSLIIRQPLPSMHTGGHLEAVADFRNMMAQGYVRVDGEEGQMVLIPVMRSFRGGLSFQF